MEDADPVTTDEARHLAQEDRQFWSSTSLSPVVGEDAVIGWGSRSDQAIDEPPSAIQNPTSKRRAESCALRSSPITLTIPRRWSEHR